MLKRSSLKKNCNNVQYGCSQNNTPKKAREHKLGLSRKTGFMNYTDTTTYKYYVIMALHVKTKQVK